MFYKDSEKTRRKRNFSLFDQYIMSTNPVTHLKVTKCVFPYPIWRYSWLFDNIITHTM
jgi:hypothetical protein